MAYTNNVPQANQRISDTQAPILANFTFLPLSIGQEHNFDSTDATLTYHLKASMPSMADPIGALPSPLSGVYYVNSAFPKFYNTAAGASFIQTTNTLQVTQKGSQALTTSFVNIGTAIPNNSAGTYYLFSPGSTAKYAVGQFIVSNSTIVPSDLDGSSPGITMGGSGTTLQAKVDSGSGTFTYLMVYSTP